MRYVNYGGPTYTRTIDFPSGGFLMEVVHNGPDGHHLLKPGEQCECGQLGLGIIRTSGTDMPRNDFQFFEENFEGLVSMGDGRDLPSFRQLVITGLAERKATRRQLLRRFWRQKLFIGPRWKPCVPITCPPVEEYEIKWEGKSCAPPPPDR